MQKYRIQLKFYLKFYVRLCIGAGDLSKECYNCIFTTVQLSKTRSMNIRLVLFVTLEYRNSWRAHILFGNKLSISIKCRDFLIRRETVSFSRRTRLDSYLVV
jgi:hypothetical protein